MKLWLRTVVTGSLLLPLGSGACSNDSNNADGGAGGTSGSGASSSLGGHGGSGLADAGPGDGGGIPAPGTITEQGTCDPGGQGATCTHLVVSCPGTEDLAVSVRARVPAGSPRAVMFLSTGGGGQAYFADSGVAEAALGDELFAAGFVVIDHAWAADWFVGTAGMHALSCRYATLLRWVDETYHSAPAPLCALGLSGGSYEIGYALARWDGADRLAAAFLLGGPAVTDLDTLCPSVASSSWLDTGCAIFAEQHNLSCTTNLYCTLQNPGSATVVDGAWSPHRPCTDPADPTIGVLADDGVLAPDSRLNYPSTTVAFLLGADECAMPVYYYYDAIQSHTTLAQPLGTGHGVQETAAGMDATRAAIRASCAQY